MEDPYHPSRLTDGLHPQLIESGYTATLKIRQEIHHSDGSIFMAREFDIESKKLLRAEHFVNGQLNAATNFDGKLPGKPPKAISTEYYKAGAIFRINYYRKNGNLKEVVLVDGGREKLVRSRKNIRLC